MDSKEVLNIIAQALFDKKGFNILALDLRPLGMIVDYTVIAEGGVGRHVKALADQVVEALEKKGIEPLYIEGAGEGDWIVIDYGEVVVHILQPEMREKYQLEELWRDANIVDVKIDVKVLK